MGILKSTLDFLFGKAPDVFDKNGKIRHQFPNEKWRGWDDRFKANPDYDWQHHGGKDRGAQSSNANVSAAKKTAQTPAASNPSKN